MLCEPENVEKQYVGKAMLQLRPHSSAQLQAAGPNKAGQLWVFIKLWQVALESRYRYR
jgi:hypothetical protein